VNLQLVVGVYFKVEGVMYVVSLQLIKSIVVSFFDHFSKSYSAMRVLLVLL
jgi:hypothetical protein